MGAGRGEQDRQGDKGEATNVLGFPRGLLPMFTPTILCPLWDAGHPSTTLPHPQIQSLEYLGRGHPCISVATLLPQMFPKFLATTRLGVGRGCWVNRPGSREAKWYWQE